MKLSTDQDNEKQALCGACGYLLNPGATVCSHCGRDTGKFVRWFQRYEPISIVLLSFIVILNIIAMTLAYFEYKSAREKVATVEQAVSDAQDAATKAEEAGKQAQIALTEAKSANATATTVAADAITAAKASEKAKKEANEAKRKVIASVTAVNKIKKTIIGIQSDIKEKHALVLLTYIESTMSDFSMTCTGIATWNPFGNCDRNIEYLGITINAVLNDRKVFDEFPELFCAQSGWIRKHLKKREKLNNILELNNELMVICERHDTELYDKLD